MNYFNQKEGTFRVKGKSIEYRIYHNGVQKSFYGKTEDECRRKYRDFIKQQQESLEKLEHEKQNISLQDYADYWLTTYKFGSVGNSTYDRLECSYNVHIKKSAIGLKRLVDIKSDDLQNFFNEKKKSLSLSSLKKIKEVLSPCFKHALDQDLIKKNPMLSVVLPKNDKALPVQTKKVECYTQDEIDKITYASSQELFLKNKRRYRYAPMFVFILNTGLRIGECLSLTWDDVNLNNRTITISKSLSIIKNRGRYKDRSNKIQILGTTKTENGIRSIPLNDAAIEVLYEIKQRNKLYDINSNIIFANLTGDYLCIRSVQETFRNICKDIGVNHKGLHALRHTFGSILIRNKVDIKVVSELLGHHDVKFTYNRYIHIINEQKVEALTLVNITSLLKQEPITDIRAIKGTDKIAI